MTDQTPENAALAFLDSPVARNHVAQTIAAEMAGGFNMLGLADAAIRAVREVADLRSASPGGAL